MIKLPVCSKQAGSFVRIEKLDTLSHKCKRF